MPVYVAFLRAINLGARRRFPKEAVVTATKAGGGTDVASYLGTGNVRLTSARRSAARVAADLERAYRDDRGFDVPTIVLTPAEVGEVVATADSLVAEHGPPAAVSVTLYADPPSPESVAAVEALQLPDVVRVRGRAAYVLLAVDVHSSPLFGSREFRALGTGTARNLTVLREVAQRWCG